MVVFHSLFTAQRDRWIKSRFGGSSIIPYHRSSNNQTMALFTVENSLTFEKVPREEKKRMKKKGFTRVGNPMTTVFSPSLLGKDTFQYGIIICYYTSGQSQSRGVL